MILYSLVYFNGSIVESTDVYSPSYTLVTRKILKQIDESSGTTRKSYLYGHHFIHYLVENKTIYMCVCETNTAQDVSFEFLLDIKNEWIQLYNSYFKSITESSSSSNSWSHSQFIKSSYFDSFVKTLNRKMEQYSKFDKNIQDINIQPHHVVDVPYFETIVDADIENGLNQRSNHSDSHNYLYDRKDRPMYIQTNHVETDPLLMENPNNNGRYNNRNEKHCFGLSLSALYKLLLVLFLIVCIYTLIAINCHGIFFQSCLG